MIKADLPGLKKEVDVEEGSSFKLVKKETWRRNARMISGTVSKEVVGSS